MKLQVNALVLNRYRYSESSLILRLLTKELGILGAFLRGGLKKQGVPEIGSVIETELGRRSEEGLFQISSFELMGSYFFQNSLLKIALRDTSFELLFSLLQEGAEYSAIYELSLKYLGHLDNIEDSYILFDFWLFLVRLTTILGCGFSLRTCCRCGDWLTEGATLSSEGDGLICTCCFGHREPLFTKKVLMMLESGRPSPQEVFPLLSPKECRGITDQLITYLQFHLGHSKHLQALHFFYDLL